jgi:hypothetical protein
MARFDRRGGIMWASPFGPLRVYYAEPVVKESYDDVKKFGFRRLDALLTRSGRRSTPPGLHSRFPYGHNQLFSAA